MARYTGPLIAPVEGYGQGPRLFALQAKKDLKCYFCPLLVTLVTVLKNLNYLPFKEISIQPELSSLPLFRIQGGWSKRTDKQTNGNSCVL